MTERELLEMWAAIKKELSLAGKINVGQIEQRTSKQLQILEELQRTGFTQIPGEPTAVSVMISDRHRLLGAIRARLYQP